MGRRGIKYDRAAELFDLLVEHPDGMIRSEILAETRWSDNQLSEAIQVLRDTLAANDHPINLVCDPQGLREEWLYRLMDGKKIIAGALDDDDEGSRWVGISINHVERRLTTVMHVLAAAIKATRRNSILNTKAQIYHLHLKRACEEVALLSSTDGLAE